MFRTQGYHHTTVADIAAACGLLKGSVYHYFAGKKALAMAALDRVIAESRETVFGLANDPAVPPAARLQNLADAVERFFAGREGGCLMGSLALEVGDSIPEFCSRVRLYFDDWKAALASVLEGRYGRVARRGTGRGRHRPRPGRHPAHGGHRRSGGVPARLPRHRRAARRPLRNRSIRIRNIRDRPVRPRKGTQGTMETSIVIAGYKRSPFHFATKGALAKVRPDDLAAAAIRGLVADTGVDPAAIEEVILGNAMPEGEQGMNMGRYAVFLAGLPVTAAGTTVNKWCGSSMQAIHNAAGMLSLGAGEAYVAAGVESMTRVPMGGFNPAPNPGLMARWPETYHSMGQTAETVAGRYQVTRERQQEFAVASHRKAAQAVPTAASPTRSSLSRRRTGAWCARTAASGRIRRSRRWTASSRLS